MKIKPYEEGLNAIVENERNRLDVKFPPDIQKASDYHNPDHLLAIILSYHRKFNASLLQAREDFGFAIPVAYEKKRIIPLVYEHLKTKEERANFDDRIDQILKRFHLPDYWRYSIANAIVTNTLLVPYLEDAVVIHWTEEFYPAPQRKMTPYQSAEILYRTIEWSELQEFPALNVKRKISINELISWIRTHSKEIREMMKYLPSKSKTQMQPMTVLWGYLVWMLLEDGVIDRNNISWSSIEKELDEREQQANSIGLDDKPLIVPNAVELRLYYERFLRKLQSIGME